MEQEELFAKITVENITRVERMAVREETKMKAAIVKMKECKEHDLEHVVVHGRIYDGNVKEYPDSINMDCTIVVSSRCKRCGTCWTSTADTSTMMPDS